MTEKKKGGVLINLPRQIFYFAVLDGEDPRTWEPWADDQRNFEAFYQECTELMVMASKPASGEPKASFEPILEPVEALLDSQRLHGIVGAIIDATTDPEDVGFYDEKMDCLEKLCAGIRHSASPERLVIKKVDRFEVWFVTNSLEIERWSKWSTRARDIVQRAFGHMPRIDYLTTGALFPHAARRFLSDSRYFMLWREP